MPSVGKLFAIAAIVAIVLGFVRWPQPATGFLAVTVKNRGYAFGYDYWGFSLGAVLAVLAATYYWFPVIFSRTLSERMGQLHFLLSTLATAGFLLLVPGLRALTAPRTAPVSGTALGTRSEAAMLASLVIIVISSVLFMVAQGIFVTTLFWAILKTDPTS